MVLFLKKVYIFFLSFGEFKGRAEGLTNEAVLCMWIMGKNNERVKQKLHQLAISFHVFSLLDLWVAATLQICYDCLVMFFETCIQAAPILVRSCYL